MQLLYISLAVIFLLLVVALVIHFLFSTEINIKYGNKRVEQGSILSVEQTKDQPEISIPFSPYTLIMFDWDAPSAKAMKKQYLHWAVTSEKTLVPYQPPSPPPNTGLHTYQFNAYKGVLQAIDTSRDQFDVKKLKSKLKLEAKTSFIIKS